MINIVLYQPEIPPNTGNIIRLCANTGAKLHLIKPLGFELEDRKLRRAGLDYHEWANVAIYDDLTSARRALPDATWWACSTKGTSNYSDAAYQTDDVLLFGPETRGLPADVLAEFDAEHIIRIPMRAESRSLNLSNATAIILYEAWRQLDFAT